MDFIFLKEFLKVDSKRLRPTDYGAYRNNRCVLNMGSPMWKFHERQGIDKVISEIIETIVHEELHLAINNPIEKNIPGEEVIVNNMTKFVLELGK